MIDGGFPYFDTAEPDALRKSYGCTDSVCDIFGGWIQLAEIGYFIEMGVMPRDDNPIDDLLEVVEIHHDADRVEFVRRHGDADAPVMAVEGFH